jgi:serine acetyltransferase
VGTVNIGDNVLVGNNASFMINTAVPSDTTVAVNTGAPPADAKVSKCSDHVGDIIAEALI